MNIGYKIKSELSEDQIATDVASYLGYITPFWSNRFRLISAEESTTGADKIFDRFIPIYLQFKVSEGLKPITSSLELLRPDVPLQKIRSFRRENDMAGNPILYFKLRNKAKTATEFQHNFLRKFHNPPYQYALYVAPLSLKIDEYNKSLKQSFFERLFLIDPFEYRHTRISSDEFRRSLGLNPFLRGHMSIPPIVDVDTSSHYYSFSKSGGDLAWHSGEKLRGDHRLSYFMNELYNVAYSAGDLVGYNLESYANFIDKNIKGNVTYTRNDLSSIIVQFGRYLKDSYDIKLMLLQISPR